MIQNNVKLSEDFKIETIKSIVAIVLFFIVYLIIMAGAVFLTILCVYGAFGLVMVSPSILTIGLGFGLASLGFMVLFFLFKFLFRSNKTDLSHLTEVTSIVEPVLFALIDEVVKKVGTDFPKKIYLSSGVNASVFYNSSFWSMILPVKKNLNIGLGLVNTVTREEFKAILAHEFGHFSQRTMKIGSYVYNVNQVIYNMLYENESYDEMISSWANASGYFYIFVIIAIKIVQAIQWVLKKMYDLINVSYLALSREMEFHADEIAANVTGFPPLKSALMRLSLADYAYNTALNHYSSKIKENVISSNIYPEQRFVMNFLATQSDIPLENDLPDVELKDLLKYNKSKLIIKDQWASHPETHERVKQLEKTKIIIDHSDNNPASTYFQNISGTEEKITTALFKEIKYTEETKVQSLENFQKNYQEEYFENSFPKIFNGYYDDKNPEIFDLETNSTESKSFDTLFSTEKTELVYRLISSENDVLTLTQIKNYNLPLKTFDYDGVKYKREYLDTTINKINRELTELKENIKKNDTNIYIYFKNLESKKKTEFTLTSLYKNLFGYEQEYNEKIQIFNNISNSLGFIQQVTPFDQIRKNLADIEMLEIQFKNNTRDMLADDQLKEIITPEVREDMELYISREWRYFGTESYFDKNLELLYKALNNYGHIMSRAYFNHKKNLLVYEEELQCSA